MPLAWLAPTYISLTPMVEVPLDTTLLTFRLPLRPVPQLPLVKVNVPTLALTPLSAHRALLLMFTGYPLAPSPLIPLALYIVPPLITVPDRKSTRLNSSHLG